MTQEDSTRPATVRRPTRRRVLAAGAVGSGLLAAPGVLAGPDLSAEKRPKQIWGPQVDLTDLPDLYAPQEVPSRTVVDGGIDHLGLHSTDVFEIPRFDAGIFEVNFRGYFRVARAQPTDAKGAGYSKDWGNFRVQVNIVELRLHGEHTELGPITVNLDKSVVSVGEIFPPNTKVGETDAQCRIATKVTFDIPSAGVRVTNREPILLMNRHVRSIPPVEDPSGQALLYRLPLFEVDDLNPDAIPFAYLTSLKYGADHYLTKPQVKAIMEA